MKKIIIIFVSILFFTTCTKQKVKSNPDNIVTDDLGKSFNTNSEITKIISLAPNLTELIFSLGVGNKIVGDTKYCNYPDSAKNIEKVGDLLTVDAEKIISLEPDIVFITVEGNSRSDYEKLKSLGMKVFVSNPRSYKGIKKTLLDMSKILHRENIADSLIKNWDERIKKVKKTHKLIIAQTVLFLVSTNPIFAVGQNSFMNEILTFAGLKNIAPDKSLSYPMFSREEIVKQDPDYILMYETNTNKIDEILKNYPEWYTLKAVIDKRVFYVNADLFSRPGPRFVDAVEYLNKLVLSH